MARGKPFAKGNPGGPGRPKRAVEEKYLTALSEGVSIADWKKVVSRAVMEAKQGDAKARDWLSKYLLPETTADAGGSLGGLAALIADLSTPEG